MVERVEISGPAFEDFAERTGDADAPSLSFVVPVYDDPDGIEHTIRSIRNAPYPDLEILAVLTPSTGETRAVLDDLSAADDRVSVLVEDEYETPGAARNVGVERADGDVLVFTDADMAVESELPWKLAYAFEHSSIDYLGYSVTVTPAADESLFGWYDRTVRFPTGFLMELVGFCPTCALAVRGTVVEDGVEFNPDVVSAEDLLFGKRVEDAGFDFGYCPDVHVEHPARNSIGAIVEKGKKTGRGWYQVYVDESLDVFARHPLVLHRSFLPDPPGYLRGVCDEWESMGRAQRSLLYAVSYVENLSKMWGYALGAVSE